jgi:hypothetical protein
MQASENNNTPQKRSIMEVAADEQEENSSFPHTCHHVYNRIKSHLLRESYWHQGMLKFVSILCQYVHKSSLRQLVSVVGCGLGRRREEGVV